MSKIKVQCKGSGQRAPGASLNSKRSHCNICGHMQDVTPKGKFRKHMRLTTTAKLRRANGSIR